MPTYAGQVNEEQLLQLISFIKSLSPQQSRGPISTTAPALSNNPQTGPATPESMGAKSTESQRSNPISTTPPSNNPKGGAGGTQRNQRP
jgi:hypothetical protein